MGIRCLFGHEFEDPQTEEQRDERGDEVVVTTREYKVCTRCGREQTISENTEVKRTDPTPTNDADGSPESADEDAPDLESKIDAATGSDSMEDVSAAEDDGVILDDEEAEDTPDREHGAWPETEPNEPGVEDEHEPWPDDEDEAIDADTATDVDAPASDADRSWPDAPDEPEGGFSATAPTQETPEPTADAADATMAESPTIDHDDSNADAETDTPSSADGPDADVTADADLTDGPKPDVGDEGHTDIEAPDDDAEFIDAEDHEASIESDPTTTAAGPSTEPDTPSTESTDHAPPQASQPVDDDTPDVDDGADPGGSAPHDSEPTFDSDPGIGIESDGSTPAPTGRHRSTATDTVFVCPSCGYSAAADDSSLRPGDICPECRRGYLAEHDADA